MQKELPEPKMQGSTSPQGEKLSPESEEKMRLLARYMLDKIIKEHKIKLDTQD